MNTIILIGNKYMLNYIEGVRQDGMDIPLAEDLFALYMSNPDVPYYWIQLTPTDDTALAPIANADTLLKVLQQMCKEFPENEIQCWLESEELFDQIDAICDSTEVKRMH